MRVAVVAPVGQGQARGQRVGRGEAEHELREVLARVIEAAAADHETRRTVRIAIRDGPVDTDRRGRVTAWPRDHVLQRLAAVVDVVEREPPAPASVAVADPGGQRVSIEAAIRPVRIGEILHECLHPRTGLEMVRHARMQDHRGAERIARIARRVGAVQDFDVIDLADADEVPAWRIREARVEEIRQQQAIGIDETARALQGAGRAPADDGVAVADVARANREVRCVAQCVRRGHCVGRIEALAVDHDLDAVAWWRSILRFGCGHRDDRKSRCRVVVCFRHRSGPGRRVRERGAEACAQDQRQLACPHAWLPR